MPPAVVAAAVAGTGAGTGTGTGAGTGTTGAPVTPAPARGTGFTVGGVLSGASGVVVPGFGFAKGFISLGTFLLLSTMSGPPPSSITIF